MDKSEPTLVPEWLKSSGNVTGGGATVHQFVSSSLNSDDHPVSKPARNKLSANIKDNDLGRSPVSDRTTSSYFRQSSSSNGSSQLRSYGSFGRSHLDRDRDKDINEYRDKDKSLVGDHRHQDYSDPLGSILPSRFEKDGLRRSQSTLSGKRVEPWLRKLTTESSIANKNNLNNASALLAGGNPIGNVHKAAFERDFPSLGAEERQTDPEIGRVPSPGLSTAIHSLPVGTSAVIGGDGWTSALAEVPVIVGSNGTSALSVQQAVHASSASLTSSTLTGLNMAETLAQGPRVQTTTPQLSVGTLRLEELAIKQSRQLIPMTPAMPKALVLNPSEKPKPKAGQQISSSHLVNHSLRGGPVKPDVSKTSSLGKLHVLKPARDRNGVYPGAKDSLSPTNASKVANSPLAVTPLVVGSAPLRIPGNNLILASGERKPALALLEKRPTPQAQSRNDFFNLVRKKSMTNSSSAVPDPGPAVSPSLMDKPGETEAAAAFPAIPQGRAATLSDLSGGVQLSKKGDLTHTDDSYDGSHKSFSNGKNHSSSDAIRYPEEEEAAFLRSLGWEENAGEDEGLTEEEISGFYRDASKYVNWRPSSSTFQGMQSRVLVPFNSQMGSIGGISSGLSASDSKLES